MELYLEGDYYEWYCDWCDTRNVTLIHRVTDGTFYCCACQKQVLCDEINHLDKGHECRSRVTHLIHTRAVMKSGGFAAA
jgi:hypothetical protein